MRIAEKEYLTKACQKYNKDQYRLFSSKRAKEQFLDPIGLSMYRRPPVGFGQNAERLSHTEESALFECLHYIKYHTHQSINNGHHRIEQWAALYHAVRNRVVSANIGLIHKCMKRTKFGNDLDELLNLGHEALIRSAESFDPWKGFRFSTYAYGNIKRNFVKAYRNPLKIEPGADPGDCNWKDYEDPEQSLRLERLGSLIKTNAIGMSSTERLILKRRFLLQRKSTLLELGDELDLSKERIRQIQIGVLSKLKNALVLDPILR